ncbi:MAG: methionyl-tRNA formyltransferase [Bryobacterales bacterium]|nr:methionyl-tRNA formyltransferase [Bryobacterales bacterium]
MHLIFMGTPDFAVPSLHALVDSGHRVSCVYTQPDRPAGRGGKLTASAVKVAALSLGIPVAQPAKVRLPEVVEQLREAAPDAIAVVGYGQIIPRAILEIPRLGIINVHGSLLPKYRGAAPIQWAVANGEAQTGVTTMRIDEGLDTGDMLLKAATPIGPSETAMDVWRRLAGMGATLLVETLDGLESGQIQPEPQNAAEATLAPMLKRDDGKVDWAHSAATIYNRYRGFQPWPGAWTTFRGARLQLKGLAPAQPHLEDRIPVGALTPGALVAEGKRLFAIAGDGAVLELLRLQLEGKAEVSAEAFLNGAHLRLGERLGADSPETQEISPQ